MPITFLKLHTQRQPFLLCCTLPRTGVCLALFSPVTLGQVLPIAGAQWKEPWEAGQRTDKPEDESSLKASL